MRYFIIAHDNRGTERCPFGFVYLSDRKGGEAVGRVGYGAHRGDPDPYAVWPCRETPEGHDPFLRDRLRAYVQKHFPAAAA